MAAGSGRGGRGGDAAALAATGETISERAGVINLGIEGTMLAGALGGALGATRRARRRARPRRAGGLMVAALFAAIAVGAGADQIITGTAVTLARGAHRDDLPAVYGAGGAGLSLPTFAAVADPGTVASRWSAARSSRSRSPPTWRSALIPLIWWVLFRTRPGLALRATGEDPAAARAPGCRCG